MFVISLVAKQIHFPTNFPFPFHFPFIFQMTLDLIGSRIYNPPASKTTKTKLKNLVKLHFVNKGMDMINIKKREEKLTYTIQKKKQNNF